MTAKPNRKSGTRAQRRRYARRLLRDRKIYRILRHTALWSTTIHKLHRAPVVPLSVYLGMPLNEHPRGDRLTRFPVRQQADGRPMPQWDDLTEWMKVQLAVMVMADWKLYTFSIHLHPDLEALWVREQRDVRAGIRDRLRKEFNKEPRPGIEHFFVIEGWGKREKKPVRLHFHGGVLLESPSDEAKIRRAALRAGGHDQGSRKRTPRAAHGQEFYRKGPTYINYLFKAVRRRDDRLASKRVTMSRMLVGATRYFWDVISGRT